MDGSRIENIILKQISTLLLLTGISDSIKIWQHGMDQELQYYCNK